MFHPVKSWTALLRGSLATGICPPSHIFLATFECRKWIALNISLKPVDGTDTCQSNLWTVVMILTVSIAEWCLKSFASSLSFLIQFRDVHKTTTFNKAFVFFTSFLELTRFLVQMVLFEKNVPRKQAHFFSKFISVCCAHPSRYSSFSSKGSCWVQLRGRRRISLRAFLMYKESFQLFFFCWRWPCTHLLEVPISCRSKMGRCFLNTTF